MMKTMIGPDKFRAATDLYFERHDGEAATVENFITCMEEAGGKDLTQFRHWYSDAGTPEIEVSDTWDNGTYTLTLTQSTAPTPGQTEKPARYMPVRLNLVGSSGPVTEEKLLDLTDDTQNFSFEGLTEKPVPSLFGGFSAPVTLNQSLTTEERLQLLRHDPDPFNRWATAHGFAMDLIRSLAGDKEIPDTDKALTTYGAAIGDLLTDTALDPAFRALVLASPSETDVARAVSVIDPEEITKARKTFRLSLLEQLQEKLEETYRDNIVTEPYSPAADQAGKRALKNTCLSLLLAGESDGAADLGREQIAGADNMTDEAATVSLIAMTDRPERQDVLDTFYEKWKSETLVVNKWLAWQALSSSGDALGQIRSLMDHEAFDIKNPNKVRALVGAFAMENLTTFHSADGAGYDFLFSFIRELDPINPMVAARLLTAAESWKKLEPGRRDKLGAALKALAGEDGLSENTFEMATRLAG